MLLEVGKSNCAVQFIGEKYPTADLPHEPECMSFQSFQERAFHQQATH